MDSQEGRMNGSESVHRKSEKDGGDFGIESEEAVSGLRRSK
jgi:hypothetical protein